MKFTLTCTLLLWGENPLRDVRFPPRRRWVLFSYYAASSGNSWPTFRDNLSGPIFEGQESKKGRP